MRWFLGLINSIQSAQKESNFLKFLLLLNEISDYFVVYRILHTHIEQLFLKISKKFRKYAKRSYTYMENTQRAFLHVTMPRNIKLCISQLTIQKKNSFYCFYTMSMQDGLSLKTMSLYCPFNSVLIQAILQPVLISLETGFVLCTYIQ